MMTYRRSNPNNKISAENLLEFSVHFLEDKYFNPIVFCHDKTWFDEQRFSQVIISFVNLLRYFDLCGITVETEIIAPTDMQKELYRHIMLGSDFSDRIICFKLVRADFSDLNIADVKEPGDYGFCDFLLVKLYLIWKTGAALNKKVVEKVIQKNLRSSEMVDIRKKFESITGNKIIKRKDNSYEMRCVKNKS